MKNTSWNRNISKYWSK